MRRSGGEAQARLWTELHTDPAEARIAEPGSAEHARAIELLVERYEQYRNRPPEGPAIVIEVTAWRGWRGV